MKIPTWVAVIGAVEVLFGAWGLYSVAWMLLSGSATNSAAIIGVLSWRLVLGARDAFASQTTSMVLGIPQGYAIAACAAMGAFLSVVAVITAARLLKGPP